MFWHEDCLKCGCCDCRLGEVGSTLYTKANLILCKRDYLRLVLWHIRWWILCVWFQAFAAMYIRSSLFWDITRRRVVFSYRSFWTTYLPHLQGSSNPRSLENGTNRLSRNFGNYQSTLRNIPEGRESHLMCCLTTDTHNCNTFFCLIYINLQHIIVHFLLNCYINKIWAVNGYRYK